MSTEFFAISDLHIDHYLGSSPNKEKIKSLLSPHLMPADAIVVAGDISNYATTAATTIDALSDLYKDVIWVEGNHDWVCHGKDTDSFTKVNRMKHRIKSNKSHHLMGNVVDLNGTRFGGSMGQCDFSYAVKHFQMDLDTISDKWKTNWHDGHYWKIGNSGPLDIFKDQYQKLNDSIEAGANIMVSHFGPQAYQIPNRWHNFMTGYFYFDGSELLNKMNGGMWIYGHTHDHDIHELPNGVVLACNPFGYPGEIRGKVSIPKENFRFKVGM